jgi:hypothetical protein
MREPAPLAPPRRASLAGRDYSPGTAAGYSVKSINKNHYIQQYIVYND